MTTQPARPPRGGGLIPIESLTDWTPGPQMRQAIDEACGKLAGEVESERTDPKDGTRVQRPAQ